MAMDTQVSVVVGASRGIGLELAKLLLSGGHVFATCRKESDTLSDIAAQNSAFHVVPGALCWLLYPSCNGVLSHCPPSINAFRQQTLGC